MNLQNMAPNAKRSLLLTAVFGLIAVGAYLGLVEPAVSQRMRTDRTRAELRDRHAAMVRNIGLSDTVRSRIAACETNLAPYRVAMLEPLLGSFAMRAKSLVDPLATGAGLGEMEYSELPLVALPVPKHLPQQLHARLPIQMTAKGTYQGAVSFLLRLEKEFPLVTLQSMTVQAQNDPTVQRITFVFEWPGRGKSTVVAPAKKGGVR